MLFNSIEFGLFLPIVFILYWFVANKSVKLQNTLLLVSSYVFYGWWDWRFLFLIAFSSFLDFFIGLNIQKSSSQQKSKYFLFTSIFVNLGFLFTFKYYGFFAESLVEAFTFFGSKLEVSRLNIILPVGISFYTFQTLSYTIDVYHKKIKPTNDIIAFLTFVSFFPQLVAGPIERASNLLPQFFKKRNFDYELARNGMKQILWGLFKKIAIADTCAQFVNIIFNDYNSYQGSTLLLAAIFFSFQIYGDFSGYSDIAIGSSKLFNFRLQRNFEYPFFSRDIAEFWRRWHISLSSWFKDYVYIPLGGSRRGTIISIRNIFILFLVSGFWHGANWTFIAWGFFNALCFLPLFLIKRNKNYTSIVAENSILPSFKEFIQISMTFLLFSLLLVVFRSPNIYDAISFIQNIFTMQLFSMPYYSGARIFFVLIMFFFGIEWLGRKQEFGLEIISNKFNFTFRIICYIIIIMNISLFKTSTQQFIYFQF